MLNRKWLSLPLLATASLVILIASVTAYYLFFREKEANEDNSTPLTSIYTGQERVFIADLYKYVDTETKKSIERGLYDNIEIDQPDLYTGTIREGLFSKKTLPSNQIETILFLDIQPTEVTYKITLFSDPRGGRPSVNIECAPQEQQLVLSTVCKDTHHHE